MNSKSLINTCNYFGYVILLVGIIISFFVFDFDLYVQAKKANDLVEFSSESDYLQSYVDMQEGLFIKNIITIIVILSVSFLISLNLWFKANMLGKNAEEVILIEETTANEELEESEENMQNV